MNTSNHLTAAQAHARAWAESRLANGPVLVVLVGDSLAVVANDDLNTFYPEARSAVVVGAYERGHRLRAA